MLRLLVSQVSAECGDAVRSVAELSWPNMLDRVGGYWLRWLLEVDAECS